MYFSRIRLRNDADPKQLVGLTGYREHQALWNLFDPDPQASRDFLFRRDETQAQPIYYLVSQRQPTDRRNLWQIETKDYYPNLRPGQTLAFSLRANPVIARSDGKGRSQRNDLVMDIKKQTGWQKLPADERPALDGLLQQAGESWLEPRLQKAGARLDNIRADGYRQHRSYKRGQDKPIRYSTLDLQGTLVIDDVERFEGALFHGIGPAKAFGCGLLLVRRI